MTQVSCRAKAYEQLTFAMLRDTLTLILRGYKSLMSRDGWIEKQGADSLKRLLPRIEERFAARVEPTEWDAYLHRLTSHFPRLFESLYGLYGQHYDFFYHLESILASATEMWLVRPAELKALDALRHTDPYWYQSHRMVGATCYVDLFADNLEGLRAKLTYLIELGVTYLHLAPLYQVPERDNDGGYAVSSYREVNAKLGNMEQLAALATDLRRHGISLCLDFVFNHTSDEHEWAERAMAGDTEYQEYYRMFPDRELPDAYERTMRAVFPDEHPGAFTYRNRVKRWVWTTFHNYQWDLNYENPAVFNRMAEEMLFLANQGVEILRLDAVAFVWKCMGTDCQNLPEAHTVIQAFNALVSIAAPAMVFKSEAIVHPDEVNKYISERECQLSYNPQLMALLWDALATRDVRLLQRGTRRRFAIPAGCEWVNYVRCHDDIGWAFSDEDVLAVGYTPAMHRQFLAEFYTGRFPDSFARGLPFQADPKTGDARISGTCASLAGLEAALSNGDDDEVEMAIRRIGLLYAVIMTIGGIPLIYLGDELGALNDYRYEEDPDKQGDTRWVHRAAFDWSQAEARNDPNTVAGRVYQQLLRLVRLRQQHIAFTRAETEIADTGNKHVFAYFRHHNEFSVFALANFSEQPQYVDARRLRQLGLSKTMVDLVTGRSVTAARELEMAPYQFAVLSDVGIKT